MKAVVQYLAYMNGLVTNAEAGIMLDQAGPNAIGTVAGVSITTPAAQIDLGDLPRPNKVILRCHPDNTVPNGGTTFNVTQSAFANVNNPNRADEVVDIGWNQSAAGAIENVTEAASMIQLEHGFSTGKLSAPAAPTLSTNTTGGTILAGTYKVEITYTIASSSGETTASASATITTTGSASTITINSPPAVGNIRVDGRGSATGWYAYVTQAGGNTFTRQQVSGSPTAIGTNLTLTQPPTSSGAQPPATNTASMTNDESHLQYIATSNPSLQIRAWSAFFDWDSGYVNLQCQLDQLNIVRTDNAQPYFQIQPNLFSVGDGVIPMPIAIQLNNQVAIEQTNSTGSAKIALLYLDSSNVIQIGNGPGALPTKLQLGSNYEFDIGQVGQSISNQATVRFGQNPSSVRGSFNLDGGNGSTATPLYLSGSNLAVGQTLNLPLILGGTSSTGVLQCGQVTGGDAYTRLIVTDTGSGSSPQAYITLRNNTGGSGPSVRLNSNSGGADGYTQDGNNNITLGISAPATSATNGFPYMPAMAGAPTGTPTAKTGYCPYVYDTTNHKLWIYDTVAAAWKGIVLT